MFGCVLLSCYFMKLQGNFSEEHFVQLSVTAMSYFFSPFYHRACPDTGNVKNMLRRHG